eukprot:SAG22_NODE_5700_length_969_cov_1.182759_1_plen_50_part_10
MEPGNLAHSAVIGCDGVLGSGAEVDHCGVCQGDGNSCKCWARLSEFRWLD